MTVGVILAGGKGSRFGEGEINKTAVKLAGKPLVKYGTDLLDQVTDKIVVVVGAAAESVKLAVGDDPRVVYVRQMDLKGTGYAARTAVEEIVRQGWKPDKVWLGYGDHMMFYSSEVAQKLGREVEDSRVALALITGDCPEANHSYGRIVRKDDGSVERIVEHKDATDEQKKIREINAGFYCFKYDFLARGLTLLEPSSVTGEYYVTDLINIAVAEGLTVKPVKIPYTEIGIGVNTQEELASGQQLMDTLGKV